MTLKFPILLFGYAVWCWTLFAQSPSPAGNVVFVQTGTPTEAIVRQAAMVVPSDRQFAWQRREFSAFIHFSMNTFTGQEWGTGTASPTLFNPKRLDARQWVKVCKEAGIKQIILTAKHHDGFCLWPSKYTDYSVKNSPWRNGQGDVVRELSDACREFDVSFGIYLSPWDRHEKTYGNSPLYNQFFENQLTELLSEYGTVSEVWFDGANGEGPNGLKQAYDWKAYYAIVRKLQPGAVIAVMGPDVRWVGTESGYGRETEWSVIPWKFSVDKSGPALTGQDVFDKEFIPHDLTESDLGSREKLAGAMALSWYPAEVDVSIRPGWFYHAAEDNQVKSARTLEDLYYSSIGRNAVLLLNLPPDQSGLLSGNDIQSLMELRRILNVTFRNNLASGAAVKVTNESPGHGADYVLDANPDTYWMASDDSASATFEWSLVGETTFNVVVLQEEIRKGQRVESFAVDAWSNGSWKEIARGTTIGFKRLLRIPLTTTGKVRLRIEGSRLNPTLSEFGLYRQPPVVQVEPTSGCFLKSTRVILTCDAKDAKIRYTMDGRDPDLSSPLYTGPLAVQNSAQVKALACLDGQTMGLTTSATFRKARYRVTLRSAYSPQYSAGGPLGLADGLTGGESRSDPAWQGYEGDDVSALVDLGAVRTIDKVSTGFLQDIDSWIFFPEDVEYSCSVDGRHFGEPVKVSTDVPLQKEGAIRREFRYEFPDVKARYVKIIAKNIGQCPPWHPGSGRKAWIFVDEIGIE